MEEDIVAVLRHNCDCTIRTGQCFGCECADEIERLRAELVRVLKPKDIWHDCSHCQGHEPSDNG